MMMPPRRRRITFKQLCFALVLALVVALGHMGFRYGRFLHAQLWATAGETTAQLRLAGMYEEGRGARRNGTEVLRWLRRAAEGGLAEAQADLANRYMQGKGVPRNQIEAMQWSRRAAEQGHVASQFRLGVHHRLGLGVLPDPPAGGQVV